MKLFPLSLAIGLLVFGLAPLEADAASISGTVYEDSNNNAGFDDADDRVGGAQITLIRLSDEEELETIIADENGDFDFGDIPPGEYILFIEYITGMQVTTVPFTLGSEDIFIAIPVVTRATLPFFTGLRLVNPANTRGENVSPFTPFGINP